MSYSVVPSVSQDKLACFEVILKTVNHKMTKIKSIQINVIIVHFI